MPSNGQTITSGVIAAVIDNGAGISGGRGGDGSGGGNASGGE